MVSRLKQEPFSPELGFDLPALVEHAALELVHKHSLSEIEDSLATSGVTPEATQRLLALVPSAFARERFESEGIEFPNHFLVGPVGRSVERSYDSEPFYAAARELARRWIAESRPSLVMRVLDWSVEADAIKKAREQGLTPARMAFVHHHDFPLDAANAGAHVGTTSKQLSFVARLARAIRRIFRKDDAR